MNVSSLDISIKKVEKSRIGEIDPANIQFGKNYSDHMLIAYYENVKSTTAGNGTPLPTKTGLLLPISLKEFQELPLFTELLLL